MEREFLQNLSNERSRSTFLSIAHKIEQHEKTLQKGFLDFDESDIIKLFTNHYNQRTSATVCNAISMLRKIYNFYNKDVSKITIKTLRENSLQIKEQGYFSPSEIKEIIDSLDNAQDKALVLLIYMGFYDKNFETIRHIRKEQLFLDTLVFDEEGIEINLNSYAEEILEDASLEEYNYKPNGDTYDLNDTAYIFRGRVSKNKEALSSVTLKKRLKLVADILGIDSFTAIKIKHSRTLYDLVKLELKNGRSLKRHEIRNFCVLNDVSASIELLERKLREMREKITKDIYFEKDYFIG